MKRCHVCRRPIDLATNWFVIEKGVIVDGHPMPADRPLCSVACRDSEGAAT